MAKMLSASKRHERGSIRGSKPFHRSWDTLTPREKALLVKVLEVKRLMIQDSSLNYASRSVGVDSRTVKVWLGKYLIKKNGRWKAEIRDRIPRGLVIYEKGTRKRIIVNDSDVAAVVGKYFNDIKRVLESGDVSFLDKYKKLAITDAEGKRHKLECQLDKLKQIEFSREDLEFSDVYAD